MFVFPPEMPHRSEAGSLPQNSYLIFTLISSIPEIF
jgi:hypothetical protein